MHARVTTFPGLAPERIKATLEDFKESHLPKLEQAPGYQGMWAGVDFTGGRAIAVTFWESLEAMHATDELASEVRAAAVTVAGVDRERRTITDRYEVVIHKEAVRT
jgi:heme-degrading monooxygenase HmoA